MMTSNKVDSGKPFRLVSTNYNDDIVVTTFKCLVCGCDKVYRPKCMYGLTHLEGSYRCRDCKSDVNYASDDFVNQYFKPVNQLQLL